MTDTNPQIAELEAMLEKATPGPWEAWGGKPSHDNVSYAGLGDPTDWPVCSPDKYKAEGWSGFPDRSVDRVATAYSTADQEFICATRNLLPTLLQCIKDKDAEIERLRGAAREFLAACYADFGDPDDFPNDDGSVALGADGGSEVTFRHMRQLKEALK